MPFEKDHFIPLPNNASMITSTQAFVVGCLMQPHIDACLVTHSVMSMIDILKRFNSGMKCRIACGNTYYPLAIRFSGRSTLCCMPFRSLGSISSSWQLRAKRCAFLKTALAVLSHCRTCALQDGLSSLLHMAVPFAAMPLQVCLKPSTAPSSPPWLQQHSGSANAEQSALCGLTRHTLHVAHGAFRQTLAIHPDQNRICGARLFVRHIPGHQDPTQCDDSVASWSGHWNDQADLAAEAANNHRSPDFQALWDAFTAALHHMEKLQRLHLEIAEAIHRRQPAGDEDEDDPSTAEPGPVVHRAIACTDWVAQIPPHFAHSEQGHEFTKRFGLDFTAKVTAWLTNEHQQAEHPIHLSWVGT